MTEKQRAQTAARQQRFRARQKAARRTEQSVKGLPALPAISTMPGRTRWRAALSSAQALVAMVQDEMADYHGNRSEAWQESDAATEFEEHQGAVDALLSQFDEVTL